MAYKQGFLYFSALVLALVLGFGGIMPMTASAMETSCAVAGLGDPDDVPVLVVKNIIIGGTAQPMDFTISVANDDGEHQNSYSKTGADDGASFELEAGTFSLSAITLLPDYEISVFNSGDCVNDNQISNGEIITYNLVSTYQPPVVNCDIGRTEKADVNDDGIVDALDMNLVIGHLGCQSDCGVYDVTNDGKVNNFDVLFVRGQFGCSVPEEIPSRSDDVTTHRSNSGSLVIPLPAPVTNLVLGASTINWSALSVAEKEELIAPFRQQLLAFLLRLQLLLHR